MRVSTHFRSSASPSWDCFCLFFALEKKRLGHHGHGEGAHIFGDGSQNRRAAGSGAAAQPGGDEDHVRAGQHFADLVPVFQGGVSSDLGIGPRSQALGQLGAQLQLDRGHADRQGLGIRVCADEFHSLQIGMDHGVDGVAAAPADAHDLQVRAEDPGLFQFQHAPPPRQKKGSQELPRESRGPRSFSWLPRPLESSRPSKRIH